MKSFLEKNWPLLLIPVVIVLLVIAVILALEDADPNAGFSYPL